MKKDVIDELNDESDDTSLFAQQPQVDAEQQHQHVSKEIFQHPDIDASSSSKIPSQLSMMEGAQQTSSRKFSPSNVGCIFDNGDIFHLKHVIKSVYNI